MKQWVKALLRGVVGMVIGVALVAGWLLWGYPPRTPPGAQDSAAMGMGMALIVLLPFAAIFGFIIGVYLPLFMTKRKSSS